MKLNITKASVEALPFPESGKTFYYDLKLQGFGLYVTKTGKMYFAEGRAKGSPKKIRVTIGRHGQWMPDAARDRARAILVQMDMGENPNAKDRSGNTLAKLVKDYLSARTSGSGRQIKQTTKEGYEWLLATPLAAWNDTAVKDFTPALVKAIHKKITEDSGPACANNCLRLLRACFRFMDVANGIQAVTELSRKHLWNPEKRRTRYLESELVGDWIKAADKLDMVTRGLVLMMLFTGLRKNEVLTLTKSQIRQGAIWLTDTKNGEDHMVPMGPYLQERIAPLMKLSGEWLFPSEKSESGHVKDPRKAIASRGKKISAHDLRRTFVSHLNALEPAPSAYTIKRLMNHRQNLGDVTAGYIQVEDKKLREVITRLEQAMLGMT